MGNLNLKTYYYFKDLYCHLVLARGSLIPGNIQIHTICLRKFQHKEKLKRSCQGKKRFSYMGKVI